MKFLITGASGFIGQALCAKMAMDGAVLGAVRAHRMDLNVPQVYIPAVNEETDWLTALKGVDVVIHLAARAHVMKDISIDPLAEYRRTNVAGSLNLARQAVKAGVRRFVFISSIKVNGEDSAPDRPITEHDLPAPAEFYAISKNEAEIGLRQIAEESNLQLVIIRPPLVYGPGVKANFAALVRAVKRGVPLPLGSIDNRRSLIALDNLIDFIVKCATQPQAAGHTFLISDGHDLSTPDLITRIAHAAGVAPRLIPVPNWILMAGASLLGRRAALGRLCGNLQVDISLAGAVMGWKPPISVEEGLRKAVAGIQKP